MCIRDRAYCNIKELADKTGKTETKVRKDLKLMIEKRMFLQGHLDQKETCLIVTDAMYQQYLETEKQAKTVPVSYTHLAAPAGSGDCNLCDISVGDESSDQ